MALEIIQVIIYVLGYFIIAISLVPLIRNDNWVFRIFEYPRAQKLFINIVLLVAFAAIADWESTHEVIFLILLIANALYLFYQVYPYTVIAKYQMKGQKTPVKDKHFKLLVCNVYQHNRNYEKCLNCIRDNNPDIILLVETDAVWSEKLAHLKEDYQHHVLIPIDNTYGMLLFSKLELIEPRVKYLVEPDVPSIHTRVKLPSGDQFFLYCLHPEPPVPQENPRSTERDAEILMIAKEAKACKYPAIVAGDLNDVAWSYTTELFMKISGLLDPRRGRGFFNTFHARYWFLRWPLDHIFCSSQFQLNNLQRLPAMGSDHFPILVELGLVPGDMKSNKEHEMKADSDEVEEAEEKIHKAGI